MQFIPLKKKGMQFNKLIQPFLMELSLAPLKWHIDETKLNEMIIFRWQSYRVKISCK